ncbi:hypothetical protein GJ631_06840 [Natronomonas sp. CBA1123]|uniref:DUF5807 family protein n=1 Tax=Natronomonas sp. CBA1123 TaxID=2668070 RepID=UPI0012EA5912|nr:DUF5807 family protein [Natronomonas sp. CBA1123]MUV86296.1 hypothetical protein [Natronomonas sp. CBA1123]
MSADDDRPASALYDAFLEGERVDDILVYLHEEGVGSMGELLEIGTRVDDGVVLVLPGKEGRSAFQQATGLDAMDFAGMAMQTDGDIDADCTGGTCPDTEDKPDEDHYVKFVFAFAEEQNEGVGGIYADGDVIHGYAACACGTTYSDKWVVDEA